MEKEKKQRIMLIISIVLILSLFSTVVFFTTKALLGFTIKNPETNNSQNFSNQTPSTDYPQNNFSTNDVPTDSPTNQSQDQFWDYPNLTDLTPIPSEGGGSSGGGLDDGLTPACIPTISCLDYPGQCGTALDNGCDYVLDCSTYCDLNESCTEGFCVSNCPIEHDCQEIGFFCNGNQRSECAFNSSGCLAIVDNEICPGECYLGTCLESFTISSCQNINSPGDYNLNTSIENNSLIAPCITITSSKVIINCQGNSIKSSQSFAGIYANQSFVNIKNCSISMGLNFGGFGIEIENSSGNIIENNNLSGQYSGVYLRSGVSNSIIKNNDISNNNNRGIHLSTSYNNSIENNTVNLNNFYGILLTKSSKNIIYKNDINDNFNYNILIEASLDSTPDGSNIILNNKIRRGDMNIYVKTSNNIIKNNLINESMFYHGLYIYNATNSTIENNTIDSSYQYGIRLRHVKNSTVLNNTVVRGYDQGLRIDGESLNNLVLNNSFCLNSADIYCESNQTFDSNNCDSGEICGGSCSSCSGFEGMSITGRAIAVEDKRIIWDWLKEFFGI